MFTYVFLCESHLSKTLIWLLVKIRSWKLFVDHLIINRKMHMQLFLLLQWFFLRFFLILLIFRLFNRSDDRSSGHLLNVVKHWRVCADITHKHPKVWISYRKSYSFFSKLAIHFLKTRKFIFSHHKGIRPNLYKRKKLRFSLLPSLSNFFSL